MKTPEDMGDAMERIAKLRVILQVVLDQVDYTNAACSVTVCRKYGRLPQ